MSWIRIKQHCKAQQDTGVRIWLGATSTTKTYCGESSEGLFKANKFFRAWMLTPHAKSFSYTLGNPLHLRTPEDLNSAVLDRQVKSPKAKEHFQERSDEAPQARRESWAAESGHPDGRKPRKRP